MLDELCAELERDPASLECAYFLGWAIERPLDSAESLHDYLGRHHEAGTDRFVFSFARQSANGMAVTPETWQSFAGEVLASTVTPDVHERRVLDARSRYESSISGSVQALRRPNND
jgi:hypothetical protein